MERIGGLTSEYLNKGIDVKAMEEELLGLIKQYNEKRGVFLFVYAGAIGKPMPIPDVIMSMDDYFVIHDMLRKVAPLAPKRLDFYIETPGGSGEAAEEIARLLRSRYETVSFVVSGEAKSAGTILILTGNELLMTDSGSLGPIDAQIRIGRTVISASDYTEWVKQKVKEAKKKGKLNAFDATMIAQISPGELKLVHYSLEFAKDIVRTGLAKYKFKDWSQTETRKKTVNEKMKEERADEIAGVLANHSKWRTHGRSIKIGDLEEMGLKVVRLDDDPPLAELVYRIQTIIRLLFSTTNIYKIFATENEKIFKNVLIGPEMQIPLAKTDAVVADVRCPNCNKNHKVYLKIADNPKIDEDFKKRGAVPFPQGNKLRCECGFEIDLSGLKNEVEAKTGKKVI